MKPPLCICSGPKSYPTSGVHVWLDRDTGEWYAHHPTCPIHHQQLEVTKRVSAQVVVDTLPAGPALDALVAERVMGFKWDESRCRVCGWPLYATLALGCVAGNCSLRPRPARMADEPAPYSTEIKWAWELVERLKLVVGPTPRGGWMVQTFWDRELSQWETAETAPLAICRAALKAVKP